MKTTWQEIKERVELKIGEDIDMSEFSVLANEAISDLQEVAMVKAPVMHYGEKDIMMDDEEFEFTINDINVNDSNQYDDYLKLSIPFNYHPGYGEIELVAISPNAPKLYFKEDDSKAFYESSFVYIKNGLIFQDQDLYNQNLGQTYKLIRKTMSVVGKQSSMNELVIKKPDNMFIPIDLRIIAKNGETFGAELTTSSNSMDEEYRYGTKTHSAYYINDGKIHIFTEICNIESINFTYYKAMDKIKKQISAEQQIVELEPGFENLLTFAICHKWLENFVGVDDQETQTMFKKYLTLKQEYEVTAKQRKMERRQTRIIEAY